MLFHIMVRASSQILKNTLLIIHLKNVFILSALEILLQTVYVIINLETEAESS